MNSHMCAHMYTRVPALSLENRSELMSQQEAELAPWTSLSSSLQVGCLLSRQSPPHKAFVGHQSAHLS